MAFESIINSTYRACPLCGSRLALSLLTLAGTDARLRRCACRMVYLDRPCDPASERAYYADHIARVRFHRPTAEGFQAEYRRQLPALDQAARLVPAHARVLDVGCGNGFLLYRLRELGCAVRGIDLDAGLVGFCRDELGLEVTLDDLESFAGADVFDAVVMTDVLEHLPDPLAALRRVRQRLAPGGTVVVKVPNWQVGRAYVWLARHPAHFQPNLHIQAEHLNYFAPRTLAALFRKAGLGDVRILPAAATYEDARPGASPLALKAVALLHKAQSALSAALPGTWACTSCVFGTGKKNSEKVKS